MSVNYSNNQTAINESLVLKQTSSPAILLEQQPNTNDYKQMMASNSSARISESTQDRKSCINSYNKRVVELSLANSSTNKQDAKQSVPQTVRNQNQNKFSLDLSGA